MKINVEIKPKEWLGFVACILVIYLLLCGKVDMALDAVRLWLRN